MKKHGKLRAPWIVVGVVVVLLMAAAAGGCGGSDEEGSAGETTAPAATTEKEVRIAFHLVGAANSFAQAMLAGAKEAADEMGATIREYDPNFDPSKQLSQIQDATAAGNFDAFLIHATDANVVVPAVEDAIAEGIKVVAVFNPMGPDLRTLEPQVEGLTATVSSSITDNGGYIGQLIIEACADKNPCEVAYVPGQATLPLETVRLEGMKAKLEGHDDIKLVAMQDGGYLRDSGLKVAQNLLQAHPDLDVIATSGDQMSLGAEQAIEDAGKSDAVALIGNGASKPGVEAVKDGRWFGTVILLPFTEGKRATELAIRAARGETVPTVVDSSTLSPVGPVATQKTVGTFEAEWEG
jgi:ribose transport system substrate-binding protein